MPLNRRVGFLAARRKRCRQRNAVLTATPHRSAEAATVSLSLNEWPKSSQRSFLRNRASGVPVSALKLLRQSLQRKRRRPSAWPPPTDAPPQCGQRLASPKRSSPPPPPLWAAGRPAPPRAPGAALPSDRRSPPATLETSPDPSQTPVNP